MSTKRTWGPPGWPWELELLALVFVIIALTIPFYLSYMEGPSQTEMSLIEQAETARRAEQASLDDQRSFFWAVIIIGLYVGHLIVAAASIEMISTPFIYLFTPLVFSMITYYRLYMLSFQKNAAHIVSGNPMEIAAWVLAVIFITLVVTRIRMSRHMARFKGVTWDIVTKSQLDGSFFSELLLAVRPFIYPPRFYKACNEGILIEGWLYIMPISFHSIQSVESVKRMGFMTSGKYLATSTRTMMRIQLSDTPTPIYISPKDRDSFLHYCNQYLSRGKSSQTRDTLHGN